MAGPLPPPHLLMARPLKEDFFLFFAASLRKEKNPNHLVNWVTKLKNAAVPFIKTTIARPPSDIYLKVPCAARGFGDRQLLKYFSLNCCVLSY